MSSYTVLLDVWLDHARSMSDGSFLVDLWMEQARLIKTMDHELSLVSAMAFLVLVFFVSGKLTFSFATRKDTSGAPRSTRGTYQISAPRKARC